MIDLVKEFEKNGSLNLVVTNLGGQCIGLKRTKILSLCLSLRGASMSMRFLYEIYSPIAAYFKLMTQMRNQKYDAVVCYSPSIFWFVLVRLLGKKNTGKKILILRDLFPLWLAEVGALRQSSIRYRILDYFCLKQLQSYDVVLVQDEHDIKLLKKNYKIGAQIDVLWNWYTLSQNETVRSDIVEFCRPDQFKMAIVGNFGIAQDLMSSAKILEQLMESFSDLSLLFLGQGPEARLLFRNSLQAYSDRTHFAEKMTHDQIMNLLPYTDAGYFSLDARNNHGHLPGKVLAYLLAGRPVFGFAGDGAPISQLLQDKSFGMVTKHNFGGELLMDFSTFKLLKWPNDEIRLRAKDLYSSERAFSSLEGYINHE